MADGWVLIDTSAWVHALRPTGLAHVRNQVRDILIQGRAATCEMVILELAGGARTEGEYRDLREDLAGLQQLAITASVWEAAYGIAQTLRGRGVTVPATDHLIGAVALTYRCYLLHRDRHFELLAHRSGISLWDPQ